MAESLAAPGHLSGSRAPRASSVRRVLGASLVAVGLAVAVTSVLGSSSNEVGGPPSREPSLALTREGAGMRACFGSERCVTTSSATDFAVRLDAAGDAASSVLLILAPSGTVVDFGAGDVTKTAGRSVATVFSLEGAPRCVDFSMTLPGSNTPSRVSVDMTKQSTGVEETSFEQACRAL